MVLKNKQLYVETSTIHANLRNAPWFKKGDIKATLDALPCASSEDVDFATF